MFATPRTYPIIVRLSTALGDIRSDRIRLPRGMAIKVMGVSGPKALPADNSTNQDILLVNHKSYFSDAAAYLSAQRIVFELEPRVPDFLLRLSGLLARGLVKLSNCTGIPIPMILTRSATPVTTFLARVFIRRERYALAIMSPSSVPLPIRSWFSSSEASPASETTVPC